MLSCSNSYKQLEQGQTSVDWSKNSQKSQKLRKWSIDRFIVTVVENADSSPDLSAVVFWLNVSVLIKLNIY